MKDSGIEWLGEIPEHWEVKKIKHLLKKKKGALKTGPFGSQLKNSDLDSSGEFKVYTQRNILDNDFIVGDDKINEVKFQTLKEFLIEEGDILFTSRGTIGVCNVFPADSEPGILHPCLIRIQIDRNRLNQDWIINYVNNSSLFIDNVKYESNATTIEVIYGGTLKETALPVPPIQEQQSIVHHIESECSKIDFKKARTEELIELLTEYRTALISEAVTGKIKVTED
ncbi:MAG TPA: restriction endonuclease subunit S [Lachnospiraceae bacterium]|nr:restriction endonuclease subunit S [Lachnospiraceae bacterium]